MYNSTAAHCNCSVLLLTYRCSMLYNGFNGILILLLSRAAFTGAYSQKYSTRPSLLQVCSLRLATSLATNKPNYRAAHRLNAPFHTPRWRAFNTSAATRLIRLILQHFSKCIGPTRVHGGVVVSMPDCQPRGTEVQIPAMAEICVTFCLHSDSASSKPCKRRRATLITFVLAQCR